MVVRRVLEQLPVLVAVAPRDLDQARRLEDEVALRPLRREAVGRPARDDDVVALLVGQRRRRSSPASPTPSWTKITSSPSPFRKKYSIDSIGRQSEISTSSFHISSRRPVIVVALGRRRRTCGSAGARARRAPTPRARSARTRRARDHAARRLEVVEDRLVPGEALEAHDLLGQQRPVVAELDVALARDVAEALVHRHEPKPSQSTARAASRFPTAGANLKPCPEQAEPTTIRPWRSRMNRSSSVVV